MGAGAPILPLQQHSPIHAVYGGSILGQLGTYSHVVFEGGGVGGVGLWLICVVGVLVRNKTVITMAHAAAAVKNVVAPDGIMLYVMCRYANIVQCIYLQRHAF